MTDQNHSTLSEGFLQFLTGNGLYCLPELSYVLLNSAMRQQRQTIKF